MHTTTEQPTISARLTWPTSGLVADLLSYDSTEVEFVSIEEAAEILSDLPPFVSFLLTVDLPDSLPVSVRSLRDLAPAMLAVA